METILKLNSGDIKKIIAKHYQVPERDVVVFSQEICVGQGTDEHYISRPAATVLIETEGAKK